MNYLKKIKLTFLKGPLSNFPAQKPPKDRKATNKKKCIF